MQTPKHPPRNNAATPRTPHGGSTGPGGGVPAGSSQAFHASASKHVQSMRTTKAASSKKAQTRTVFKPTMATPYQIPWQPATLDESHRALTILADGLHEARSTTTASTATASSATSTSAAAAVSVSETTVAIASPARPGKRKREADDEDAATAADDNDDGTHAAAASAAFPGLCVGINAVTRAASAGALDLVLLCRDVKPVLLIAHLPVVCQMKRIPLLTLNPQINTRMLAQVLEDARVNDAAADAKATPSTTLSKSKGHQRPRRQLQLCTTIGIKRDHLASTVASLLPFAAVPSLPWLTLPSVEPASKSSSKASSKPSPTTVYVPVNVLNTDVEKQKGGGGNKNNKQQTKKQQQQPSAAKPDAPTTAGATVAVSATPPASVSPDNDASMPDAATTSGASAPTRFESATQRKKKQKLQQQQQQQATTGR